MVKAESPIAHWKFIFERLVYVGTKFQLRVISKFLRFFSYVSILEFPKKFQNDENWWRERAKPCYHFPFPVLPSGWLQACWGTWLPSGTGIVTGSRCCGGANQSEPKQCPPTSVGRINRPTDFGKNKCANTLVEIMKTKWQQLQYQGSAECRLRMVQLHFRQQKNETKIINQTWRKTFHAANFHSLSQQELI
jgi:hypothetical protein